MVAGAPVIVLAHEGQGFSLRWVRESRVPEGFAAQIAAGQCSALPTPLLLWCFQSCESSPHRGSSLGDVFPATTHLPCSLAHKVLTTVSTNPLQSFPRDCFLHPSAWHRPGIREEMVADETTEERPRLVSVVGRDILNVVEGEQELDREGIQAPALCSGPWA